MKICIFKIDISGDIFLWNGERNVCVLATGAMAQLGHIGENQEFDQILSRIYNGETQPDKYGITILRELPHSKE